MQSWVHIFVTHIGSRLQQDVFKIKEKVPYLALIFLGQIPLTMAAPFDPPKEVNINYNSKSELCYIFLSFPFRRSKERAKASRSRKEREKKDKTENRRRPELVGWTVVGRTDERTSQFFATPENPPFAEQTTKLLLLLSSGFRAFLRVKASSSSCSYTYKRVLALRCPRYLH